MEWPANSPDHNPIEHLWSILKQRLLGREPAENLQAKILQLQEEWDNIPQDLIRRLIESMPRRCAEVLRARGGRTHY